MTTTILSDDARRIREHGWKQGAFLKVSEPLRAYNGGVVTPGVYLLISQNCNIQTPPIEVEPLVEVLLCQPIEKCSGNLTKGKNPRAIHLPAVTSEGKNIYLECEIKNKNSIHRSFLLNEQPFYELKIEQKFLEAIINWVIKISCGTICA